MIEFLTKQCSKDEDVRFLNWDTPYDFDAYSDELWENFQIVTGVKPPEGKYRSERPPFRCAC
jgi:hypothetical protein